MPAQDRQRSKYLGYVPCWATARLVLAIAALSLTLTNVKANEEAAAASSDDANAFEDLMTDRLADLLTMIDQLKARSEAAQARIDALEAAAVAAQDVVVIVSPPSGGSVQCPFPTTPVDVDCSNGGIPTLEFRRATPEPGVWFARCDGGREAHVACK